VFQSIERIFLRLLLGWALLSIALGGVGLVGSSVSSDPQAGHAFLGAMGLQFLIWGAINAALAGLALRGVARRETRPLPWEDERAQRDRSVRILSLNAKLDLLWIAIGVALLLCAIPFANHAPTLLGHGVGVVLQGGFLLIFDRLFARRLRSVIDVKD
jgi:hypothetical protein